MPAAVRVALQSSDGKTSGKPCDVPPARAASATAANAAAHHPAFFSFTS